MSADAKSEQRCTVCHLEFGGLACPGPHAGTVVEFTCECDIATEQFRRLYLVTGHDGTRTVCSYCDDCAYLAAIDWNGETAAIEPYTRGG